MYKRLSLICLLLGLFLALTPLSARTEGAPVSAPMTAGNTQNGMVRVRLSSLGNFSTLNLTVYGSYTVNGQSNRSLGGGASVTVKFSSSTGQWTLTANGNTSSMGPSFRLCRHEASGQNGVKISQGRVPGNLYPGDFQFVSRQANGSYVPWVIVHVYMEDYLYGVLPYEMGNSSGMEALKAQAVAARTYTMQRMSTAGSALYDVVDTTADQVYSGTPSGSANCKAAVDATKGIAVKNGSGFTYTYYTASNGGQTESIKNAWGTSGIPYLGVKDDPYDLANPDSRTASFSVNASGPQSNAKLESLLKQKAASQFGSGATVTAVTAVTPHTPKYAAPSRLYTKLSFSVVYTRNGSTGTGTLTFDIFNELESALSMNLSSGGNELWSVTQTASGFTVTARRYGHGIGMSQRGAMYMDKLGYTYDQILGFYYEGCVRVEYTLTRSILSAAVPGQSSQEQIIAEPPAPLETPSPTPENTETAMVATKSGSLNLRQKASGSAKVLCTIPQYETISILERGSTWCKTVYGGYIGYVMTAYLSFSGTAVPSPTPAPFPAPQTQTASQTARVVTEKGSLNLREAARSNARVLRTIPQYDMVAVLQKGGDWCQVAYAGTTGYVMTKFLSFDGSISTPAPASAPAATPAPQQNGLRTLTMPVVGRVMSTASSLNLRDGCSTDAKIILEMPKYDALIITAVGDTWCAVEYEGHSGYCMTKYLEFELYE